MIIIAEVASTRGSDLIWMFPNCHNLKHAEIWALTYQHNRVSDVTSFLDNCLCNTLTNAKCRGFVVRSVADCSAVINAVNM